MPRKQLLLTYLQKKNRLCINGFLVSLQHPFRANLGKCCLALLVLSFLFFFFKPTWIRLFSLDIHKYSWQGYQKAPHCQHQWWVLSSNCIWLNSIWLSGSFLLCSNSSPLGLSDLMTSWVSADNSSPLFSFSSRQFLSVPYPLNSWVVCQHFLSPCSS